MKEIIPDYQLNMEGGRVKSAGIPLDFVFEQGDLFQSQPGPEVAAEIGATFLNLRKNPPGVIRSRFFPLSRGEVKALTRATSALYRPILKTDQGPGKFLGFKSDEREENFSQPFKVSKEQGYVIVEAYFKDQLEAQGYPENIMKELKTVREHFASGNLPEARLAFERLQITSEEQGLIFTRQANVGRNGLMFIHPAAAEQPIILPGGLIAKVEDRTNLLIGELIDRAEAAKKVFAQEQNISVVRAIDELSCPAYFQADVQLLPNREVMVAELQIPDVGLFLCGLNPYGNEVFSQIQKVVMPLKNRVITSLKQTIEKVFARKGQLPIYLVTRSEVIENQEDVLEIRELAEIQKELNKRGFESLIISASQAARVDDDSLMFIFNLNPNPEEFKKLAVAYLTNRRLIMVPDPFLRVVEKETTDYPQIQMSDRQIVNFFALVGNIETRPTKIYSQLLAVDYFLRQLGAEEEVLHFCHPTFPTPISAYRYDLRSLRVVANILQRNNLRRVLLRSIPISPERGVLIDKNGGILYATFRFMFTREE